MLSIKTIFSRKFAILSCLTFCSSLAFAAPLAPFSVAAIIPYNKDADPVPALNQECKWNEHFMTQLVKYTKEAAKVVVQDSGTELTRKLVLSVNHTDPNVIASKTAPAGLEVFGTLFEKDQKIGDFLIRREVMKGSLNDCNTLNKLAAGVADDVENWLGRPSFLTVIPTKLLTLKEDTISEEQKRECSTDTFLLKHMEKSRRGQVRFDKQDFASIKARKLQLTALNARLLGGGAYSGAKWIELDGKLFEDNKLIGSFKANRWTIKGWTGCGSAERLGEALAQDIHRWLMSPTMNAYIGDARPEDQPKNADRTEENSSPAPVAKQ